MPSNTASEDLLLYVVVAESLLDTLAQKDRQYPEQWIVYISRKLMLQENNDSEILKLLDYACYLALCISWGDIRGTPYSHPPPQHLPKLDTRVINDLTARCQKNVPDIIKWAENRSTTPKRNFIGFPMWDLWIHPWIAKPIMKNFMYGQELMEKKLQTNRFC